SRIFYASHFLFRQSIYKARKSSGFTWSGKTWRHSIRIRYSALFNRTWFSPTDRFHIAAYRVSIWPIGVTAILSSCHLVTADQKEQKDVGRTYQGHRWRHHQVEPVESRNR